ncbi:ribonuclease HII [Candidatus Nomurabacteria bacterium]|nr:ribonuclease HII [Candidatus Nomurabacteria bacterium]
MKLPKDVTHIIGIDEVGRGPLAGPVTVGACVIPVSMTRRQFAKIRDSKQLTHESRVKWHAYMLELQAKKELNFVISSISPKQIDSKGLSWAIRTALEKSLYGLKMDPKKCLVLLDGGLKAPREFMYQKTIIKGDEKELSISLASIAAKVTRDAYMTKLAKKYPVYGFEIHKGYGTKKHREAIRKYGVSDVHRRSFLRNIV